MDASKLQARIIALNSIEDKDRLIKEQKIIIEDLCLTVIETAREFSTLVDTAHRNFNELYANYAALAGRSTNLECITETYLSTPTILN